MEQTLIHVSDKFFTTARSYFKDMGAAVEELIQNSFRSYFPLEGDEKRPIEISYEGVDLAIMDKGCGITDIGSALSIADSGWDGSVMAQRPAGMGLCAILAFSTDVTVYSHFGKLTIDSNRFFHDTEYRANLLNEIEPQDYYTIGTRIRATLCNSIINIDGMVQNAARYRPAMYLTLNGTHIEPAEVEQDGKYRMALMPDSWVSSSNISVAWFGCAIRVQPSSLVKEYTKHGLNLFITPVLHEIRQGKVLIIDDCSAIKPVLPDRTDIQYTPEAIAYLWEYMAPAFDEYVEKFVQALKGIEDMERVPDSIVEIRQQSLPPALATALIATYAPGYVTHARLQRTVYARLMRIEDAESRLRFDPHAVDIIIQSADDLDDYEDHRLNVSGVESGYSEQMYFVPHVDGSSSMVSASDIIILHIDKGPGIRALDEPIRVQAVSGSDIQTVYACLDADGTLAGIPAKQVKETTIDAVVISEYGDVSDVHTAAGPGEEVLSLLHEAAYSYREDGHDYDRTEAEDDETIQLFRADLGLNLSKHFARAALRTIEYAAGMAERVEFIFDENPRMIITQKGKDSKEYPLS